jgi:hypothetical protein
MTDSIPDTERPAGFTLDPLLDMQTTRNRIAADAADAVGTGSTGPQSRQDAYAARLFPGTNAALAAQMADHLYSCAMNYRAACRAADVDFPPFSEDYSKHTGACFAEIETMARRFGAYLSASEIVNVNGTYTPDAGDAIVVEGPDHCIVITGRVDAGYTTSEGGLPEVDPKTGEHGMCIHGRTMALRVTGGRLQTGTVHADGSVEWGRFAIYLVDASKLRRTDE